MDAGSMQVAGHYARQSPEDKQDGGSLQATLRLYQLLFATMAFLLPYLCEH